MISAPTRLAATAGAILLLGGCAQARLTPWYYLPPSPETATVTPKADAHIVGLIVDGANVRQAPDGTIPTTPLTAGSRKLRVTATTDGTVSYGVVKFEAEAGQRYELTCDKQDGDFQLNVWEVHAGTAPRWVTMASTKPYSGTTVRFVPSRSDDSPERHDGPSPAYSPNTPDPADGNAGANSELWH